MYAAERSTMEPTDLKTPIRNRYFYGKLLDVYHFQLETNYLNYKRWLLNRLSGYGVVCGLDVNPGTKPNQIKVEPGVAIDKWGREMIIPQPTPPIAIPTELMQQTAEACQDDNEEACITVLLCYHECESDPAPVLAGSDCSGSQTCAPGIIREQYEIKFAPGPAPSLPNECQFPDFITGRKLDYPALVRWVSQSCPELPENPCIPLADLQVLKGEEGHHCGCHKDDIDINIRPICYSNDLLFELLLSLLIEETPRSRGGK